MTTRVPLVNGKGYALVDDADLPLVESQPWYRLDDGHGHIYAGTVGDVPHSLIRMHNLIMGCKGIDHINGDGLDNRRANLRPATHRQNMANRRSQRGSASRFKGVYRRNSGRWGTGIWDGQRYRCLGTFDTEEEAAAVYDAAAVELHGEFARLNLRGM